MRAKYLAAILVFAVLIFVAGYRYGHVKSEIVPQVSHAAAPMPSPSFSDGVIYGSTSAILMVHRGQSPTWPVLTVTASNAWYAVQVAHSMTWEAFVAQTEDLALARAVQ